MKKQGLFLVSIVALIGLCVLLYPKEAPVSASVRLPDSTLILDAGHGGEDGGAVAVSGTPESGINLSIVLKMDQLCGLYGVSPVLVRDGDESLADENASSIREKKRTDLMNRVKLVSETENAVLISVHQNNFSSRTSHGAQIFYHSDPVSQLWAVSMQALFKSTLDPQNKRKATKIPPSVYLMNHISCRSVLVECGFLSNPDEDVLLEDDAYQTKLAAVMTASYLTFDETSSQGATIE